MTEILREHTEQSFAPDVEPVPHPWERITKKYPSAYVRVEFKDYITVSVCIPGSSPWYGPKEMKYDGLDLTFAVRVALGYIADRMKV